MKSLQYTERHDREVWVGMASSIAHLLHSSRRAGQVPV